MIVVDERPFPDPSAPASSSQGRAILAAMLEHRYLVTSSDVLKAAPAMEVTGAERSPPIKHVYVFQREYATVNPSLVDGVGTDEATTCVGLVIRNRNSGTTSVGHLDNVGIVDMGLTQMLSLVSVEEEIPTLDVHMIGGFQDVPSESVDSDRPNTNNHPEGYSFPLCCKIAEALHNRPEKFHVQTICVLEHNTKKELDGSTRPIISGFLVNTGTGCVIPASFGRRSRCPDELVRRVRLTVSSDNPDWGGRLLETYNTYNDRFHIAPFSWRTDWAQYAFYFLQLTDSELLRRCSTSPAVEGPDFAENEKRKWMYLLENPDWRPTFVGRRPRIFERTDESSFGEGGWSSLSEDEEIEHGRENADDAVGFNKDPSEDP